MISTPAKNCDALRSLHFRYTTEFPSKYRRKPEDLQGKPRRLALDLKALKQP